MHRSRGVCCVPAKIDEYSCLDPAGHGSHRLDWDGNGGGYAQLCSTSCCPLEHRSQEPSGHAQRITPVDPISTTSPLCARARRSTNAHASPPGALTGSTTAARLFMVAGRVASAVRQLNCASIVNTLFLVASALELEPPPMITGAPFFMRSGVTRSGAVGHAHSHFENDCHSKPERRWERRRRSPGPPLIRRQPSIVEEVGGVLPSSRNEAEPILCVPQARGATVGPLLTIPDGAMQAQRTGRRNAAKPDLRSHTEDAVVSRQPVAAEYTHTSCRRAALLLGSLAPPATTMLPFCGQAQLVSSPDQPHPHPIMREAGAA